MSGKTTAKVSFKVILLTLNKLLFLDGKHYTIVCPDNSASRYHNYKGQFSILSLVICDADHRVLYYKTGLPGSASDAGSWMSTDFYQAMESGHLNIPSESDDRVTFHLLADNGFALSRKLVVPFNSLTQEGHERDFNYRHSRYSVDYCEPAEFFGFISLPLGSLGRP